MVVVVEDVTWLQEDVLRVGEKVLQHLARTYPQDMADRHGYCVGFAWAHSGGLNFLRPVGKPNREKLPKYFDFVRRKAEYLSKFVAVEATYDASLKSGVVPGGAIRVRDRQIIVSISGLTEMLDTIAALVLAGKFLGLTFAQALLILEQCPTGAVSVLRSTWDYIGNP